MEFARALEHHLTTELDPHLEILRQMVGINSFTLNPKGIDALGELTSRYFESLGFTTERIESTNPEHGHHLVMSHPAQNPSTAAGTIGLVSHLDTVFTSEEEEQNSFRWREEGDRIYGPGTVDIKGGTVMIHLVLGALKACAPAVFDSVNWVVLLDAAEEVMSADFGALARERLEPDGLACLVFEGGTADPDGFRIVTRRKGSAVIDVSVTGRGAHAGIAHGSGASAIWQLARTIDQLSALTDYERDLSVNVGTVTGGTTTNRVPHEATARLETRAFDPDVLDGAINAILETGKQADVISHDGEFTCHVDIDELYRMPPWPQNDGTEMLFSHFRAAGADTGVQVIAESRGGLSDGNTTWATLPTLDGLGPVGANLHCSEHDPDAGKEQEYIERASFVPKALVNALGLVRLIEGRS